MYVYICICIYTRSARPPPSPQKHLEARGRGNGTDPVSGKPLSLDQTAPNLALRDAVEAFLQERPWAYQCMED